MIWFSADTHLGHKNIIKYCKRPFSSVEEMDGVIFNNFEKRIKKGDTLYFLGDLTFREELAIKFFDLLGQAKIHYIIGNHDSRKVIQVAKQRCESVSYLKDIKINKQPITLCHYAMRVWNKSHYGAWQLHGHTHGSLEPIANQWDVGIDNNDFRPVWYDDIKRGMNNKRRNLQCHS